MAALLAAAVALIPAAPAAAASSSTNPHLTISHAAPVAATVIARLSVR